MGRLSPNAWEHARAEYEVNGKSLREVANLFGIAVSAMAKRVKKEGWKRGKSEHLVQKKVNAIKELVEVERESEHLPFTLQEAITKAAFKQAQADLSLAEFDVKLIIKGHELLDSCVSPDEWEAMTRGRKNIAFKPTQNKDSTTVNVNQQQAQELNPPSLTINYVK